MEPKITTWNWKNDGQSNSYESTDTITLNSTNYSDTVIGGGYSDLKFGAVPNVTINSGAGISNTYPYAVGTGLGGAGGPFTFSAGTNAAPWYNQTASSKIRLDGADADIEVNGWSLIDSIKRIEQRLNILTPNAKLETEWSELRELGEQYRKLEQHIKDKQATWDRLKAMPPPEID
jgi:hypothetical protein